MKEPYYVHELDLAKLFFDTRPKTQSILFLKDKLDFIKMFRSFHCVLRI